VLTVDGLARRSFAVAPWLAAFAAFAVTAIWRLVARQPIATRWFARAGPALLLVWSLASGLGDELRRFPASPEARWVFAQEMAEASRFVAGLPSGHHVYFYSDRWSYNYETRRFLAPGQPGEDRSTEFGAFSLDIAPEHGAPVFVLLDPYEQLLPVLAERFPGGETITGGPASAPSFVAYLPEVAGRTGDGDRQPIGVEVGGDG
jgi:hypothetical protein